MILVANEGTYYPLGEVVRTRDGEQPERAASVVVEAAVARCDRRAETGGIKRKFVEAVARVGQSFREGSDRPVRPGGEPGGGEAYGQRKAAARGDDLAGSDGIGCAARRTDEHLKHGHGIVAA